MQPNSCDDIASQERHGVHWTVNCKLLRLLGPSVLVSVLHSCNYIAAFKKYFEITMHFIRALRSGNVWKDSCSIFLLQYFPAGNMQQGLLLCRGKAFPYRVMKTQRGDGKLGCYSCQLYASAVLYPQRNHMVFSSVRS